LLELHTDQERNFDSRLFLEIISIEDQKNYSISSPIQ